MCVCVCVCVCARACVCNQHPKTFLALYFHVAKRGLFCFMSVSDVCADDNDQLTYRIPKGIAGDKFTVDAVTGLITTTQPLDREEKDTYTITGNR